MAQSINFLESVELNAVATLIATYNHDANPSLVEGSISYVFVRMS